MITFIVLAIILAILVVVSIAVLSIGGASVIIIFGDLIVCIAIIAWLIKKVIQRR